MSASRREYSFEEDVKILKNLQRNCLWGKVLGNNIWKEMRSDPVDVDDRRSCPNYYVLLLLLEKRINFGARGSYVTRVKSGALQSNESNSLELRFFLVHFLT